MEEREFNRATLGVASTMAMSGRVTTEAMNPNLETGKEGSFGRIARLTFVGSLMTAGLFVALAPMRARAEDKDVRAEIEALQNQVAGLQATVSALKSQLQAVQSNPALALGPFVSVDPNPEIGVAGPHITFKGANIHIVSGSGMTNDNGNPPRAWQFNHWL